MARHWCFCRRRLKQPRPYSRNLTPKLNRLRRKRAGSFQGVRAKRRKVGPVTRHETCE